MANPRRVERAARARRDGNQAKVTVLPDTAQRQATAAVARVNAAEVARRHPPAPTKALAGDTGQRDFDLHSTVEHMNVEFVQCRDFGHSWRPYTARWVSKENAYESQLRCQRCKTIRTRWLSARGEILSGSYDYADGYTMPPGMGRLSGTDRDVIRLKSIRAVLAPDTAEDE